MHPMMLTVVFEHWHLGDGTYPALTVGDEARLSFELDLASVTVVPAEAVESIRHLQDAEYEIVGCVIRQYPDGISSTFPVIEAEGFRFYCPGSAAAGLTVGIKACLRGRLAFDHYQWVEFLDRYPDPPDLFYGVRVTRVRRVRIPERFISRTTHGESGPTALAIDEYGADDVRDVPAVDEEGEAWSFSLLDLEFLPRGAGPQQPTFITA